MKKIKILPLLLCCCLFFALGAPTAFALDPPTAEAEAIVVADINSGNIFYEKNMNAARSPASLTKMMTCLIAVEAVESGEAHLTDSVTAQADCLTGLDSESSTAGIQPGEVLTFEDLLYCALIKSANEACNIIAEDIDGTIDAFVAHMNQRAAELGCANTTFVDPNGLSNSNTTTAYDLSLIAREAIQHPLFATICDTAHYQVPQTNMTEARDLYNSNALITTEGTYGSGYLYNGASGVKTGYTRAAGYCLVSTASRDNINVLVVVMGCNGPLNSSQADYGNFTAAISLFDWVFENFSYRVILASGEELAEAEVQYAPDNVKAILRPEDNLRLLIPNDVTDEQIDIEVETFADKLVAPIAAGTQLGTARVFIDGQNYASVKLITTEDIAVKAGAATFEKIQNFLSSTVLKVVFIVLLIAAILYVVIMTWYKIKRRQHLKARMEAAQRRRRDRAAVQAAQEKAYREAMARNPDAIPVYRESDGSESRSRNIASLDPAARDQESQDIDELIRSLGLDRK